MPENGALRAPTRGTPPGPGHGRRAPRGATAGDAAPFEGPVPPPPQVPGAVSAAGRAVHGARARPGERLPPVLPPPSRLLLAGQGRLGRGLRGGGSFGAGRWRGRPSATQRDCCCPSGYLYTVEKEDARRGGKGRGFERESNQSPEALRRKKDQDSGSVRGISDQDWEGGRLSTLAPTYTRPAGAPRIGRSRAPSDLEAERTYIIDCAGLSEVWVEDPPTPLPRTPRASECCRTLYPFCL